MTRPRNKHPDNESIFDSCRKALDADASRKQQANAKLEAAARTATAKSPVITSIRRGPGGWAEWLISIEGICTDAPMRDRKLRRYRKFCNAIKHRFDVSFDPMPQADWAAIVEAAIAAGGGAR